MMFLNKKMKFYHPFLLIPAPQFTTLQNGDNNTCPLPQLTEWSQHQANCSKNLVCWVQ